MNKKDDSIRNKLLDSAREMAESQGVEAINIRALAKRAGVATGTVYNYFSSKDDILLALTEEYWRSALQALDEGIPSGPFCRQLEAIYQFLQGCIADSAGRLMSSLVRVEKTGRLRMETLQEVLNTKILTLMEQDQCAENTTWNHHFTREEYARFILINLMAYLRMGAPDISFFLQVVERTLYTQANQTQ